jgi:hypothetical protein
MADKRERRSKDDIMKLRKALVQIVNQHRPLTVRHLFYLAVAAYLIEKIEAEYKNVIIRLTGEMREDWLQAQDSWWSKYQLVKRLFGADADHLDHDDILAAYTIPFGREYIVDAGRWIRKPESHESFEDALRDTARYYRRALWSRLPIQVHVFCEKDAIADLVYQETAEYDVPLAVMRGDSSKTFLWECAAAIRTTRRKVSEQELADDIEQAAKPAMLYLLVDYDDKGRSIIRSAVERIQRYAPKADISWEVLAITEQQIKQYNLPTRPEKKDASRNAVELDALPPNILRELIRNAIGQHVPEHELRILEAAEKSERSLGMQIARKLPEITEFLHDMNHGL